MNNKLKIILVGGSCSGKTTLCKMLATKYKTIFVNEVLENYMNEHKLNSSDCTADIVLKCMEQQAIIENELYKKINNIQFCEGTSFSAIDSFYSKQLEEIIKLQLTNCSQIFLCNNNIPYIDKKVRPKKEVAINCHNAIVNYLNSNNINYILLNGNIKDRIKIVDKYIEKYKNSNN